MIEKPKSQMPASTPISATGMVALGMMVAFHWRKKSRMVRITMAMVKPSVISTSSTETRMNSASSEMTEIFRSSNRPLSRSTDALIASDISMVLLLACRTTPSPMICSPFNRTKLVASAGAK